MGQGGATLASPRLDDQEPHGIKIARAAATTSPAPLWSPGSLTSRLGCVRGGGFASYAGAETTSAAAMVGAWGSAVNAVIALLWTLALLGSGSGTVAGPTVRLFFARLRRETPLETPLSSRTLRPMRFSLFSLLFLDTYILFPDENEWRQRARGEVIQFFSRSLAKVL